MSRNYTLSVRDFGPIGTADVELRPMTVLVGPSNTGKSYFATLIYALHRCLSDRRKLSELADLAPPDPDLVTSAMLSEWAQRIARSKADVALSRLPDLPQEVDDFVESFLAVSPGMDRVVEEELKRCFSVRGMQELLRRPEATDTQITLAIPRAASGSLCQYRMGLDGDGVYVSGDVAGEKSFARDQIETGYTRALYRHLVRLGKLMSPLSGDASTDPLELVLLVEHVLLMLCLSVQSWLLHPVGASTAHYLPSDRAGLAHTRDVVVSSLLRRASSTASERGALLSGVSADFLDQLVRLSAEPDDQDPAMLLLARRLEEAVLGGDVRAELPEAGLAQLWYRPAGWKRDLPLMRASSMVVELAPFVLYLRHVVRQGDLLIIDEPESHLHPGLQVEVIRRLADVVHSGVRVIITTHSEWVLEELSNLVLTSQLPDEKLRDLGSGSRALTPGDVGVWAFESDEATEGSFVSEIKLEDSSLYSSSFDEVAADTHNRWTTIADLLEGA